MDPQRFLLAFNEFWRRVTLTGQEVETYQAIGQAVMTMVTETGRQAAEQAALPASAPVAADAGIG